eukprot:m.177494 g.177494  ORF g.177494 m.177494 type:complete len:103 (+) comp17967_c0_seq2:199-507(+)
MAAAADAKSKARLYMRTRAQDHVLEVGQMLQRTVKNSGSSETLMRAAKQFAARDSSIAATRSALVGMQNNTQRLHGHADKMLESAQLVPLILRALETSSSAE